MDAILFPDFENLGKEMLPLAEGLKIKTNKIFSQVCDAMNVVSGVAWQLNRPIFDIQLDIFRNGGNTKLAIPPPKPANDSVVSFVQESSKERFVSVVCKR